jgi:hypothetical protein
MPTQNGGEPTQETQPRKGEPEEIPVPTRRAVLRDLGKVTMPQKTLDPDKGDDALDARSESPSEPPE